MGSYRENDLIYTTSIPLPVKKSTNKSYGNLIMGIGDDNKAHFLKAIKNANGEWVLNSGSSSSEVATLVTEQDLTTSYVNFGDVIDTSSRNSLGLFISADCNDSEDVDLEVLGLDSATGTEYEIEGIATQRLWTGTGTNFNKYFEFDVGTLKYLQIKAKAGTLGVTPAFLTGGTSAQSTASTWEAVTDGSFAITIDGTDYNIDGIDFTGDLDMDDVAETIQTAIRAATSSEETVVWSTDHFIISSVLTEPTSEVSVTSTSTGTVGTDISGAGAADWMDSDTGNGTETAVDGVAADLTIKYNLK